MIQLIVTNDYQEMGRRAALVVADQMKRKADSVIGFATGSTPLGLYQELIKMYKSGKLDFSQMTTFNLDEYVGLTRDHPQSYYRFMWDNLFSQINVRREAVHFPDGVFENADVACQNYEKQMEQAGGIDLQILGIGRNGHIGFNEPDKSFKIATHIVDLCDDTIEANSRFFESKSEVPRKAITMGIGSIMKAKTILLLASGQKKAEAVKAIFTDRVDPEIPATVLRLHPNVIVLADREAASHINQLELQES